MNMQNLRFRVANKGKGQFRAEGNTLWLYDVIASDREEAEWWGGIAPQDFIEALAATTGPVTLRINSPGGSVFGAQAIVAAMRAHPHAITARVDSLAASAASVIACEAAHCEMVPGSMMMIHKAWGVAIGNADDMRGTADLLEKIDGQIAATYARRSAGDVAGFLDMMAAETWFDAAEAQAAGLADAVTEENSQTRHRAAAQAWDLSAYVRAPALPGKEQMEAGPEASAEDAPDSKADTTPTEDAGAAIAARQRRLQARLLAEPI
jgi:ATP-dependent Clp protease, protease subunit